jgi:hypothetical protein
LLADVRFRASWLALVAIAAQIVIVSQSRPTAA